MATAGLRASRRDGRVRAAITDLLDHAHQHNCSAVVVENLNFADARATGRETLGRGQRGKRLRRTVAGIPTARFRTRLTGMASRRGIAVIGVDPAYTSRWGAQHWREPLQQQTSEPVTDGTMPRRPRSADVASDWRSGGGRQDPAADSGPLWAHHRPGPNISRAPHNDGAAVPAHRHAHHEASRSTGKHPPPAANTVRAAQDSLLLTNQERSALGIAGMLLRRRPFRIRLVGPGPARVAAFVTPDGVGDASNQVSLRSQRLCRGVVVAHRQAARATASQQRRARIVIESLSATCRDEVCRDA